MCSGRVDLKFILRAFSNGQDGVFIVGCRLNECNYVTHGNYHALNTALLGKRILEHIGLNPERLNIQFMSAGDGILFAEHMNAFDKKVKELGPLGVSEGIDRDALESKIKNVERLVPYIKIAKRENLGRRLTRKEDYEGLFTKAEVEELFREVPSYYIDPEKCRACMTCFRRCPAEAIVGGKNRIHVIDQDKCIKCGTCLEVCPPKFGAVTRIVGGPVPPPIPEDKRMITRKGKKGESA
jgi:coenzyme F420-reducing hydrogenase delta subunit/Fe-S-cluster-containing hydrogenase component 2